MKKIVFLFLTLLSTSVFANHQIEISQAFIRENTMLIRGEGLTEIQKATLGNKPVGIVQGVDIVLYCKNFNKIPCKNERWVPGTYTLKLFKYGKKIAAVKYPITITGNEKIERLPILPVIPPRPVDRNEVLPTITPKPVGREEVLPVITPKPVIQ